MGYPLRQPLNADLPDRSQPRLLSKWFAAMLFVALLGGLIASLPGQQYDGSRIAAGPYPWPKECPQRSYSVSDRLPRACFSRFQKISHDWMIAHGLKLDSGGSRGRTIYYRLGDAAVDPLCVAWEDFCAITAIYPGLFVIDPKISGTTSTDWRTLPGS